MKLNCLIVEDEPIARKVLEEFIEEIDFLHLVAKAENPIKASSILSANKIDLLFLDVNMPMLSGIEFLKNIKNPPMVIMVTAYAEYAVESFSLDVLDYLVKPISFERFWKASMKARDYQELKENSSLQPMVRRKYFFIKSEGIIEKVLFDDLLYIEGLLNYVVLHTNSGKMIVYMTIKSLMEQLPNELFIRVHKSHVVNIDKVDRIEGNTLHIDKHQIIISQSLRDEVLTKILKDKMIKR